MKQEWTDIVDELEALKAERGVLREVQIPLKTLQWWRELVDLNPADLAQRLDACIARARDLLK